MKKVFFIIFLTLSFFGCREYDTHSENATIKLRLKSRVYDSVQTFVDSNIRLKYNSRIYLLELHEVRVDTFCYTLTTIKENSIPYKYALSTYFYNKDSSLLIVYNGNNLLYKNQNIENQVKNLKEVHMVDKNSIADIYNPLVWKLTVAGDIILMDRFYGIHEAEKNIIIPKEKFNPAVP